MIGAERTVRMMLTLSVHLETFEQRSFKSFRMGTNFAVSQVFIYD